MQDSIKKADDERIEAENVQTRLEERKKDHDQRRLEEQRMAERRRKLAERKRRSSACCVCLSSSELLQFGHVLFKSTLYRFSRVSPTGTPFQLREK